MTRSASSDRPLSRRSVPPSNATGTAPVMSETPRAASSAETASPAAGPSAASARGSAVTIETDACGARAAAASASS